jgi:hypothetical protein
VTTTLHHPRYSFDHWIAGGGMGDVWAATDTLLERPVAVKVLKQQYADDAVFRARFIAEARHAASLQHPNVATVLDYGELPDADRSPTPFLVMELVDGRPLSALLADHQALSSDVARDVVAQAADGVAAAHRLGIVHRDVKPGNLLVTPDGRVKVTDFGVARSLDEAPLTTTGQLVGTPHYLSPEQVEGAGATPASDVYALGIVLYECLTGQRPFTGDTAVATALMHVRSPLPPFPDSVPERLQEITRRATAKDPAARFGSMEAFAAALREEAADNAPAPTVPVVRRPSGRKLGALLGAIVVLSLALGVFWAVATRPDPGSTGSGATTSSTPRAAKIPVRAAAYHGMPVARAAHRLRALGFHVTTKVRPNAGGHTAATVAGLSPTGRLEPGTGIALTAWGPAPTVATPAPTGNAGAGGHPGKAQPPHQGGPATHGHGTHGKHRKHSGGHGGGKGGGKGGGPHRHGGKR